MKKTLLAIGILLLITKANAQELNIQSEERIIKGVLYDTLVVQEEATNKDVRIKLTIDKTDKDIIVTAADLGLGSAKLSSDYSYSVPLPYVFAFKDSFNMTNILVLTIKPDSSVKTKYGELDLRWKSLTEENKVFHKILVIKIIDQKVKEKDIKENDKPDTETRHRDNTNGNKIEYNQFTDFAGFNNDKPNGRMQTELRFKWGIAKNWYGKEGHWQWQPFRSIIFPDILFNRIDKSQKPESYNYRAFLKGETGTDSSAPKFTSMDIIKYSNLQVGLRAILFAFKKDNFRFHLQAGAKLVRNKPYVDTTIAQNGKTDSTIFRSTYSIGYNVEIYGKTLLDEKSNINLDFTLGIMWLRLKDSYYKQYDAAVVDQYSRATVLLPISRVGRGVSPIYTTSFRLTKNLGASDDHYFYFRGSWLYQTGKYIPIVKRTTNTGNTIYAPANTPERFHNHFLQLQFGISLDIKTLFEGSDKEKKDKTSKISDTAL